MLIVCPNCATSYDVDVASLRPDGRRVRCVRCRTVWLAELPHADKLLAAAEALGPDRSDWQGADQEEAFPDQVLDPAEADEVTDPAWDAVSAEAADQAMAADAAIPFGPGGEAPDVESPPIAPVDFAAALDEEATVGATTEVDAGEDIESVAARRVPHHAQPKKRFGLSLLSLSPLQWATLVLIVLDAIIIGWRTDFVRVMPQTASFYALIGMPVNLRGLSFENVTTSTEQHDNVPILVLQGDIVNDTRKITDVPHLRFAVRNAAHQEIYSWTSVPPRALLPPGEAVEFRTRLASPPPDAHDVLIRFLSRYDIMNEAR